MGWIDAALANIKGNAGAAVVSKDDALPGRPDAIPVAPSNIVTGNPMIPPFPAGHESIVLGMGCFWGAEKQMWQLDGVWTTAVGYAGGWTENPTYRETCTGRTGHTEAVLVVFDPARLPVRQLVAAMLESHDPTQGMRQGNDVGSQYRSAIYATTSEQLDCARELVDAYQQVLVNAGLGEITTEVALLDELRSGRFFYAEDYHQQYLRKNPGGYDCHARTGLACPV